ncbi:cell division protein SepF [Candidatus Woesearchaeota archaeon]|nr:MAG: cell division protein SepF [Candidatus Woesearchaeota archaeon]
MAFFSRLREKISGPKYKELEDQPEYVELEHDPELSRSRVLVRPFVLDDFEDVKPILTSLREGYTIALVNIRPLKDRDLIELKRAINKLKKTADAIDGEIAGFGEDFLVVCPSFASIYRNNQLKKVEE